MEYKGKVYAKIGGKYIECTQTIEDLENEIKEYKERIDLYKGCFEKFIPINKWDEATRFLSVGKCGLAEDLAKKGL